jgi:hypothetical protein
MEASPAQLTRIGLFLAGLAVLFAGAFVAGSALDPDVDDGDASAHGDGGAGHRAAAPADASAPARIVVARRELERGPRATLSFRVVDREGRTVEDFDVEHEREMHLIAVRHDLTGYRHVHPRRTADGGWTVEIGFPDSGPHRLYADFVTRGEPYTLSADVDVAGRYAARPLPSPASDAGAGDGYAVAMARDGGERRFTVTRDGRPLDDIEPYLGARGHLVAIAAGKLTFQHVHPKDRATAGRQIRFDVELDQPGSYRLFLQFKHDGEVRTAAFGERVTGRGGTHGEDDHGH